ncbi:Translation initiation factor IF-2 [Pyrenophora tritici-repentis]|nr:Translation initiation factor IF-2 [Pyrenophora tritici-repentis]KAG9380478.1 Translation initiation factor IF-2 [Pyrenophora tritici-repentis]KAI0582668.1 Translation initiation factor IF-2 [Pyrenophora tritici-repentis]KAI0590801.1 Translation initiation factor IF-2 [Pyrenophora tritici-repentis]KAI0613740.1 Translation initiation factor IF-2 [Pyrenophora tritici-repentis]
MRRAHGLRYSSPRDICILCATRQLASNTIVTSSTATQRRELNSSTRAPQSAEGIIYKDANERGQKMSQAQRMRAALASSTPFTPPALAQQGGYMSPAERTRLSLAASRPQQVSQPPRQPPPERRAMNRGGAFDSPVRGQNRDRFAPAARRMGERSNEYRPATTQNRYTVNMDSRPPVNLPAFGSENLRRRNDLQQERGQFGRDQLTSPMALRPMPQRKMLDQEEISRLLGNTSAGNRSRKPYQPLVRDMNAQRERPAQRPTPYQSTQQLEQQASTTQSSRQSEQRTTMYRPPQRHEESISDAAEAWVQKSKGKLEVEPSYQIQKDEENRRRNRFTADEPETRNRYEEPERRQGGNKGRSRRMQRYEEEDDDDRPTISKQERKRLKAEAKKAAQLSKNEPTPISLPEYISVANLAGALKLRVEDFVRKLEDLGFEDVQNDHILNAEHAGLIAQEYNFEPIFQAEEHDGDLYPAPPLDPEAYAELPARPPVVTIMGHVDHGKTTILDYMRSTSVAATEFGGITQHIGAFSVPLANGKKITFLDTPGHSAFETMRARGANVTDIVVLVVAADDSVMPQTVEAIKHAQAAQVPLIVAINKIDKAQADPDAVKLDLGRHGIEIEDFGGDVQAICVSGKTGQGIPDLEEAITTLSEMLDHRADPQAAVEGWVLEGATKKSGRTATVLVRSGTLRQGTTLVAGTTWTRVRTLRNEAGVTVDEVGPGVAVEVDGWRDQPIAGDEVLQAEDEQQATAVTELRSDKIDREQMARDMEAINESRRLARAEAERREAEEAAAKAGENGEEVEAVAPAEQKESGPEIVSFIVKGDVSGSVEAVIDSVSALGNAEVATRILRHGVGPPSEFDISHAADAKGHVINFNTASPGHVVKLAEEKGVRILESNIIYRVVENVKELLSEKLAPKVVHKVTAEVEVAASFEISLGGKKKMTVAGSKVRNGVVHRGTKAKVLRGETLIHDGIINTLKNQKKDVEQMRKDTECGISFAAFNDFKVGDRIQCYDEHLEKRSL